MVVEKLLKFVSINIISAISWPPLLILQLCTQAIEGCSLSFLTVKLFLYGQPFVTTTCFYESSMPFNAFLLCSKRDQKTMKVHATKISTM